MSLQLLSRSPDLRRLIEDGYEVRIIKRRYLVIGHVPYVNAKREVAYGTLVSDLVLANDATTPGGTHVARFTGDHPCEVDGTLMESIRHGSAVEVLEEGLITVQHSFSRKPRDRVYLDYHEKMTTYIDIISAPALQIDPTAKARTYKTILPDEEDSVFLYADTASSKAGIAAIGKKLALNNVAIVGLGGTGSYVLDLIAKTEVRSIHLYDGDRFLQHNAFRAPGAAAGADIEGGPLKVLYYQNLYSKMRRGIIAHETFVTEANVKELGQMDFVFMCLDDGFLKRTIVRALHENNVPFIDVGMGIYLENEALGGILRVTTSSLEKRDHIEADGRIPFSGVEAKDEYDTNIQVADLNALNAALAVIRWKKMKGYYHDFEHEHFSTYTLDGNAIDNSDRP